MERVVAIGDQPVRLGASDVRRATALERLLGALPDSTAAPLLSLSYRREGPALPARPPDVRSMQLELWFDGPELHAREVSGLSARVAGGEAWIGGVTLDLVGGADSLLLSVLAHLMFPRERYVMHAGAVSLRGRARLLLGGSGMGKSSVTYGAHRAGWEVLGDDTVMLRPPGTGADWEVGALSMKPLAVPAELLVNGAVGEEPAGGVPRRRHDLPEPVLRPGWAEVGGIVSIEHGAEPGGRVEARDRRSALAALLRSFPGAVNPALLPELFSVAHTLASRPAHLLAQGRDPSLRLRDVAACLEELSESAGAGERPSP